MGTVVFGDSIGRMVMGIGGFQGVAVDGLNSGRILSNIRANTGMVRDQDVILSTGASNDAPGRNGRLHTDNVRAQLETLLANGARHVYVMGVGVGPNGDFTNKNVNPQLDQTVRQLLRDHPEYAGRIQFGGPLNPQQLVYRAPDWDNGVHPTTQGARDIIAAASGYFGGTPQPAPQLAETHPQAVQGPQAPVEVRRPDRPGHTVPPHNPARRPARPLAGELHGQDQALHTAVHGHMTRQDIRHFAAMERALGVDTRHGVISAETIRSLQHHLGTHETGVFNSRDAAAMRQRLAAHRPA